MESTNPVRRIHCAMQQAFHTFIILMSTLRIDYCT